MKNWWEEAIIREEPLGIRISLPEYASSIIKNLKEKVPKNLQQKIERIGEVLYDVESNFPYLGSLNIGKGSRKVYCE